MQDKSARISPDQHATTAEVLIDASSAILLYKAGLFESLLQYYSVNVAKTVVKEMTKTGYPGAAYFSAYCKKKMLTVHEADPPEAITGSASLHDGEKETIALFQQGTGKFIITDDGRAARFCKSNDIPFINALLLPRILFDNQMISPKAYHNQLNSISGLGRYSEKIINFARNCSKQELAFFKP